MNILALVIVLSLGMSESIETRLPEDPGMIYTVSFPHQGVKIGLDWKNRQVLAERICRKASSAELSACQSAALDWLQRECTWYAQKGSLNATQSDMRQAVCTGAAALSSFMESGRLASR